MIKFFINATTAPASFLGTICYALRIDYPFAHKLKNMASEDYYQFHNMPYINEYLFFLLAPFQAFLDMVKDMTDIFKPYNSNTQKWRDFKQPLIGAINIGLGLINLLGSLMVFLFSACLFTLSILAIIPVLFITLAILPFDSVLARHIALAGMLMAPFMSIFLLGISTSWTANAISQLIRGTTQLLATPLTWLIKMPLRWAITALKGIQYAEDKSIIRHSTHRVMSKLEEVSVKKVSEEVYLKLDTVHITMVHAINKGQKTMLSNEEKKYNKCNRLQHEILRQQFVDTRFPEEIFYVREYCKLFTATPTLKKFLLFSNCEKYIRTTDKKTNSGNSAFHSEVVNYIGGFFIAESQHYYIDYKDYQEKTTTRIDHQHPH